MNRISRNKNNNFTIISNVFLRDKELSIKAKGFLAVIMGLPEDWEFTISGICKVLKEGKTSVYNVINELKEKRYCKVKTCRDDKGVILGMDYSFFEEPYTENTSLDNPYTGNPCVDNQPQLNTYNSNNIKKEELIDKEDTIVSKKDNIDYTMLKNEWEKANPNLKSIRFINAKRKEAIRRLLKNNNANVDDLIKAFKIVSVCSFCQGNGRDKWEATFDWVINDSKSCFNKLLECYYAKGEYEKQQCQDIINGNDVESGSSNNLTIGGVEYK